MKEPFAPFLFLRRGRVWTIVYTNAAGKKRQKATKFKGPEQEGLARNTLATFIRLRQAATTLAGDDAGPMTVTRWARQWIEGRAKKGVDTTGYQSRLEHHILPHIGAKRLDAVTADDIGEVLAAAARPELAPRSQRHVYDCMHAMFEKAVPRLIEVNPCKVHSDDLPKRKDADPEWRPTAVFTRTEVVAILTDPRIPLDRRTYYAVLFLAGARFGEVSALRRRHYTPELEPLGRLQVALSYNSKKRKVKGVKTDVPRLVPVHPWLADILQHWLTHGWAEVVADPLRSSARMPVAELLEREPRPDDLLIPTRRGTHRNSSTMWKQLNGERANPEKGKPAVVGDLERIGLRPRRQHDARRTFITLARADGARKDLLRLVTHGPEGDIVDVYTEMPWAPLCEEVAKLKLGPPAPLKSDVSVIGNVAKSLDGGLPLGCHAEIPDANAGVKARPQWDSKRPTYLRQPPPPSETPRKSAKSVERGSGVSPPTPANAGPGVPMATLATLTLRQALEALDRGRLDQVRGILERALEAERNASDDEAGVG